MGVDDDAPLPALRLLPCLAAVSSAIAHCLASASGPPGIPAPSDRTPSAVLAGGDQPAGVMVLAHGDREMRLGVGREVQPRVACSSNQSVFMVTGSSHSAAA